MCNNFSRTYIPRRRNNGPLDMTSSPWLLNVKWFFKVIFSIYSLTRSVLESYYSTEFSILGNDRLLNFRQFSGNGISLRFLFAKPWLLIRLCISSYIRFWNKILSDLFLVIQHYLCFLATLHGMWNLSSLTRDQTHAPCNGSMEP